MVFRSLLRRKFNEETLMRLGNEWYIAFVFEQSTDKIVDIHDSVSHSYSIVIGQITILLI